MFLSIERALPLVHRLNVVTDLIVTASTDRERVPATEEWQRGYRI